MKTQILLGSVLVCALLLAVSCSDVSEQETTVEVPDQETKVEVAFTKQVEVFGLHIYATNTTGDDKVLHAARVLAEYLDNDEDGTPDNEKVMDALLSRNTCIVMAKNEEEMASIPRGSRPRGQGLYDRETFPNAAEGVFDVTLEEILHPITGRGYALAYPEIFGTESGTAVAEALDLARGGHFEEVPEEYPEGAWFTYDDETCRYRCQITEYMYWALTSILGAQDIPGRLDRIGNEWRLNTREKVMEQDSAIYALLTNPEYKFPTVIPDGKYKAGTFTIQPYRHVDASGQEEEGRARVTKQVEVFGVHVYATNTVADEKLLHAARVLAEYIDNDEDGVADNPKIMDALLEGKGAIVMRKTGGERTTGPRPRGQGLYGEETIPSARAQGRFDGAWEEVLHMVTDVGWAGAYPEVFSREPGTEISNALDKARGGRFEEVPEQYPEDAWFTYDDETCDYDCMNSEYIYWALTSILGAQDYPGRLDQIGREWRLNTREKVRERDPDVYAILTNPEYKLPTVLPDGNYKAKTLTIQPYVE
jgi:hypothetical protein